jgi:hypothetical protein
VRALSQSEPGSSLFRIRARRTESLRRIGTTLMRAGFMMVVASTSKVATSSDTIGQATLVQPGDRW